MPRVIIDNQEVEVVPGSNLLAAARKLGLDIPALCHHPGCTPNTACMACVMKIKAPDRIVPSCATPAEDGLRVESETAEIHGLRRMALELLLSDHGGGPGSQPCTCSKSEVCRLRRYAEMYGARADRFQGSRRRAERQYQHPELVYEPDKCILCGICVQLARQAGEPLGLTFVGRGFDVRVDVPFDETLERALRTAARRCAGACPTGALRVRNDVPNRKPRS